MKKELRNAFGKIFLTIEYDAKNNWVRNNWIGYQTIENVMVGADACLEILKENNCAYLLNDNHQVVGPWDQTTDWIAQNWTPRAIAIGLTHFAHIVSPETFAALSAEMMSTKIGGSFKMKIFDNQQEAEQWLSDSQRNG